MPRPDPDDDCGARRGHRRAGVEAGVLEMLERMQTGRWKVFRGCDEWFEEFRLYHRKEGRLVKLADDLLSASRYAMMMRRHAGVAESREWTRKIEYPQFACL